MNNRWLRPISIGAVTLIIGLSVVGCLAMRRVVTADQRKILTERGAAVTYLLESVFQQQIASIKVLGAEAVSEPSSGPADTQRVFTAGSAAVLAQGVSNLGIAVPRSDGSLRYEAAVGPALRVGDTAVGHRATILAQGLRSLTGTSAVWTSGGKSHLGIAVPVRGGVVFADSIIDPTTPVPTSGSPFDALRGSLYAGPTPTAANLMITTETHLPLSGGPIERSAFLVGDDEWSLYYEARGDLVGAWTDNLPWLIMGVGLALASLIGVVLAILSRRGRYADGVAEQRTKSLAEANAELRQARGFMRHLVNASPLVVLVADTDDLTASFVSPNVVGLFGITEEDALRPGFLIDNVRPDQLDLLRASIEEIADGPEEAVAEIEFQLRMGDVVQRWVYAVITAARQDSSLGRSVMIYALDIDGRRRAEAAQEAAQLAADAASRSKSEFLSRMSHELRTPLNAILGYAQILEMEELRDDQTQPIEQILASGRHLLELINEVLDISRIEVGKMSLSVEPVSLGEVIEDAFNMIRPAAAKAGIKLVRRDVDGTAVFADRQRLCQILVNLVTNAVNYNRPNGSVTVACEERPYEIIRLSVTDTGPGLSPDQFDLVFAPFERLGAEQAHIEGTGIGLALSRFLAEAMGGSLGLDSTLGEGSTFFVELPLAPPVEGTDDAIAEALEDHASSGDPFEVRQRVLHIEDNPANLRLIERILRDLPGVRITSATTGTSGLDAARSDPPDLVLLDLHLPDLPGDEVLAGLRADPRTAETPVVVLSADATAATIDRLLSAGATAYLTKPIDIRALLDIVQPAAAIT